MKRIFAFIGSERGTNSNTYKAAKLLLDNISESSGEIEYEIFMPENSKILSCKGCNNCFLSGTCSRDKSDDMKLLKEKMLDSDCVIIGSPVYAHNVSSNTKMFIDRISYWMHLFRLHGRVGVTFTTSASNGNRFVNGYLYKVMQYLGLSVVENIALTSMNLNDKEFLDRAIPTMSNTILDYLNGKNKITSNPIQEEYFKLQKNIIFGLSEIKAKEYKFWEQNGYFDFDTFQDLLNHDFNMKTGAQKKSLAHLHNSGN